MADAPKWIRATAAVWLDGSPLSGEWECCEAGEPGGTQYTRADLIDMDVLRRVEAALSFYAEWEMEPLEEPSPEEREKFFILDCPTPKAMADRGEKARAVLTDLRAMMEKINV